MESSVKKYQNIIHGRISNKQEFGVLLEREMTEKGYNPSDANSVASFFSKYRSVSEGNWKGLRDVIASNQIGGLARRI